MGGRTSLTLVRDKIGTTGSFTFVHKIDRNVRGGTGRGEGGEGEMYVFFGSPKMQWATERSRRVEMS